MSEKTSNSTLMKPFNLDITQYQIAIADSNCTGQCWKSLQANFLKEKFSILNVYVEGGRVNVLTEI